MSLILKMQINDQSENKYIFSTENGEIELIPLSVIENGTYTPEEENQAYNRVTVNVPQTVLEHLDITANGRYESSSGRGYDVVTVNVQPILDILSDTITENGTYVYEPEQGYDGLEQVVVNVSVPEPLFEHLTQTITSNGTYNFTPTVGKDGFDEANITVNVPTPQPNLQTKTLTITQNGSSVVTPDTGYDGLDEVDITVNVPTGGGGGNVFETEFTLTSAEQVEIPVNYSGNGYPIAISIFPAENYKNSNLQSLVRGGSVISAFAFKNRIEVAPTYTNDSNTDQFVKVVAYKQGQNQSPRSDINEIGYLCVPSNYTMNPASQYNTFYLAQSSLKVMGQAVTSGTHFGFPVGYKFKAVIIYSE